MRDDRDGEERPGGRSASRRAVVRLLAFAVLLIGLGSWAAFGGGRALLGGVDERVDALGAWGPPVFALCYALAVVALLPGSVLTASAGALFGVPLGVAAVLLGATAGAALSFALARWLGRPAVARYTGSGRLARLDAQLSHRGFASILVIRLVPVFPFSVINYGAGVTGVRFVPYVTATALGIVPATLAYTGLGEGLRDPGSPLLWLAVGGLAVLTAVGWWAARLLHSRAPEPAAGEQVSSTS